MLFINFQQRLVAKAREELEKLTSEIIGPYPNTYTFTKALTEELIVIIFFFQLGVTNCSWNLSGEIPRFDARGHQSTYYHWGGVSRAYWRLGRYN
jgi:hypothetical protein